MAQRHAPRIVVMGVSGSGKSTVGALLAGELGLAYRDGDDLHPRANIAKMAAGVPLDDADRAPWLRRVGAWLADRVGGVIGCSALKRAYRDLLREAAPDLLFVHVHGDAALLERRMRARGGHFMPPALLGSQLATLEALGPDEPGAVFDITPPPAEVAHRAARWITAIMDGQLNEPGGRA